ncbi:MAG: hypothetical protein N3E51_04090 [Candidatus Micrarchaeota archaeon]|nr:hypothetical protein [Candidatus Micrarchaeota archaeon]
MKHATRSQNRQVEERRKKIATGELSALRELGGYYNILYHREILLAIQKGNRLALDEISRMIGLPDALKKMVNEAKARLMLKERGFLKQKPL